MEKYITQSRAYKQITSDIASGRLSHTYLFIQSDFEYTKEFIRQISKLMMCKNRGESTQPCNMCTSCLKIEKAVHSDVITYGRENKIMVEDTKNFLENVLVRPYESDKKVYILYGVDDMNESSQNKILKTLEEPPADTYMMLTTTNEYKVLQTIKSRSKKIYLDGLSVEELEEVLKSRQIKNAELISIQAGGNLSTALSLASSGNSAEGIYNLVTEIFTNFKQTGQLVMYTAKLESNKKNLGLILDFFTIFARDMLFVLGNAENLILNKHKLYDITRLAGEFDIEALLKILDTVIDAKKRIYYNVTTINVISTFLLKFLEVRIKCKK